jgi:hypothetical protein
MEQVVLVAEMVEHQLQTKDILVRHKVDILVVTMVVELVEVEQVLLEGQYLTQISLPELAV